VKTIQYIQHRLQVAGRTDPLFTGDALAALHEHSQGLPRSLNNLANMALLAGFIQQAQTIHRELVDGIVQEIEG